MQEGKKGIESRDGIVEMKAIEMVVIPNNFENKYVANNECKIFTRKVKGIFNSGISVGNSMLRKILG